MRIGILASHPIQYHAPWFRALAARVDLEVFLAHRPSAQEQAAGFGGAFEWDVDLLSGYKHTVLQNIARKPGVNRFFGCDTPEIGRIIRGQPPSREATASQGRQERGTAGGITRTKELIPNNARSAFDAFIVTGWNLKCYWQAIRACRRARIPVLVRGDSQLDPTKSLLKRGVKEITHRLMLRQFDGFLSPGQRNREYLFHYGVPEEKIFFVPHFVDNERFRAQAEASRGQRSIVRSQWSIPQESFCLLFCGKFIPKKRPMDLVNAAQLLLRSRPELKLHLLFVGSGEVGDELRAACNVVFDAGDPNSSPFARPPRRSDAKAGHSSLPNASFAGFLNQTRVSSAYVAADVLVLPSDYRETWGLVVNEAMTSELPVIGSDAIGCAPDLIGQDFVFKMANMRQFAQRLESLASMKLPSRDLSRSAVSKLQIYSVETAVNGTLAAVHKSASMGRPHG